MADFPALPLWTDAYLADTLHLTDQQHGIYLRLLMMIWRAPDCRIPNNDEWLARRFGSVEYVREHVRPITTEFCTSTGNFLSQKRLKRELEYLKRRSEKQASRTRKRWESDDRPRANAVTRADRMRLAREKGTHTAEEWEVLKATFNCCVRCGATDRPVQKDHIVPIYQGGSDGIENIQPSCAECNAGKGPENIDHRTRRDALWTDRFNALCTERSIWHNSETVYDIALKLLGFDAYRTPTTPPTPLMPTPTPTPKRVRKKAQNPAIPANQNPNENLPKVKRHKKIVDNGSSGDWSDPERRDSFAISKLVPFIAARTDEERWTIAQAAEDPSHPNHRAAVTKCLAASKRAKVGWVSPSRRAKTAK